MNFELLNFIGHEHLATKALAETVRLMKTERIKKGEEFMERSNDRY